MNSADSHLAAPGSATWRDFLELGKPKVVSLIVFTAVVGMFLAVPGLPPLAALLWGTLGIGLAASSAAAINHVVDRRYDEQMARTMGRPIPSGAVTTAQALGYAGVIGVASMLLLWLLVNPLTAVLTFASLIGYAFLYTVWLKHVTPQNIVIGGAAGAAPPVLGWTAVTGSVDPHALLLFLIIFAWTPPHFWALAIARREDYARAGIPMLPVAYGVEFTRLHILLYTILLVIVTLLPYLTGMTGLIYLATAAALGAVFVRHAIALRRPGSSAELPMKVFRYSINYLMLLFAALLIDHYFMIRP
jgi:protoheme IX farnesyltransferase